MQELQRKQKLRQLVYSIPSLILLIILTFFLAKGALGVLGKERESASRVKTLEAKAVTVIDRKHELEEGIKNLQTDEGIVAEIKAKFSVMREGEHVAIIVDERGKASSTEAALSHFSFKDWWAGVKSLWSDSPSGYNATQ